MEDSGDGHLSPWGLSRETWSGLIYRGLSDMVEKLLGEVYLCGRSVKETRRESSLAGDRGRYVEKALETGISLHRGPVWGNWRGL
jgi:hypothetical protein